MTASELLLPRFEIIANFPNNTLGEVGTILYFDWEFFPGRGHYVERVSDFPHLFKKLNWWEKRTKEQMPKKLMAITDPKKEVFHIEEWDMDTLIGWINKKERIGCSLTTWMPEYGYIPVD